MNHILCCRQSALTAVELADALGTSATKSIASDAKKVINWGCSLEYVTRLESDVTPRFLNTPEACSLAINKLDALLRLNNAGIPAPRPIPMPKDADVWIRINSDAFATSKYVARTFKHMDGSGFKLVETSLDLQQACEEGYDYLLQFIPSTSEYRVHVFQGQAFACEIKKNNDPGAIHHCRCSRHGWKMVKSLMDRTPRNVIDIGKKAVNAISLDFGAADILVDGCGNAHVLEVNTAPFLAGWLIDRYAKRMESYIKVDSNQPWTTPDETPPPEEYMAAVAGGPVLNVSEMGDARQ